MKSRFLYRPGHPAADELGFVESHLAGPPVRNGKSHQVLSDIEPFVSPVDGKEITSRSHLREHEKAHGVRQVGDDWSGREKPSWWDQRKEIARDRAKLTKGVVHD